MMIVAAGVLSGTVTLAGCSSNETGDQAAPAPAASQEVSGGHGGHGMEHPMDGGPVPAGMTQATTPKYPAGSKVTLTTDHMEGMNGAAAKIVGAYDTNTYAINYTPTTAGDPVTNHRWVVQEELKDAGDQRLPDGTKVTVTANHMDGMDGAAATIASSTDETVYVVDYEADGMTMTNHKWVVDSEMQPAS